MTFDEFNEKWGYGEIVRKAFETPGGAQRFLDGLDDGYSDGVAFSSDEAYLAGVRVGADLIVRG